MMTCDDLRDFYELYVLGALEHPERSEIDEHLGRQCPNCLAGVKRAMEFNAFLTSVAPTVEPPPRLRKRVLAGIGAPQQAGWYSHLAWPAVAAALFAGVLWFSIQERRLNSELAGARSELAQAENRARTSEGDLAKV